MSVCYHLTPPLLLYLLYLLFSYTQSFCLQVYYFTNIEIRVKSVLRQQSLISVKAGRAHNEIYTFFQLCDSERSSCCSYCNNCCLNKVCLLMTHLLFWDLSH